ncbi:MAG: hypothetical protein ACLVLH_17185 [Eisenbergiella massiliensis]
MVQFIREAARDPEVLAISDTVPRQRQFAIIAALAQAAENEAGFRACGAEGAF